jgi:hypothetical protein
MATASPATKTGRRWEGVRNMVIVSHKWSWQGWARHLDAGFSDSQARTRRLPGLASCPAVPRSVAGPWIDRMDVDRLRLQRDPQQVFSCASVPVYCAAHTFPTGAELP